MVGGRFLLFIKTANAFGRRISSLYFFSLSSYCTQFCPPSLLPILLGSKLLLGGHKPSPSPAAVLGGWQAVPALGLAGASGPGCRQVTWCLQASSLPSSALLLWLEEQGRGTADERRCMPSSLQFCLRLQHKNQSLLAFWKEVESLQLRLSWVETCQPWGVESRPVGWGQILWSLLSSGMVGSIPPSSCSQHMLLPQCTYSKQEWLCVKSSKI